MNNFQLFKKQPTLILKFILSLSLLNLGLLPFIAKTQQPTNNQQSILNNQPIKKNQILFFYNSAINEQQPLWRTFEKNENYQLIDIAKFNHFQIQSLFTNSFLFQPSTGKKNEYCVVASGISTAQKLLALKLPIKLFALDLSRNQLNRIHQSYRDLNIHVSGIYQEQSFERQILLAKSLDKKTKSVTTFLSQDDRFYLPEMLKTAEKYGLKLNYQILRNTESEIDFLNQIESESQFILLQNNKNQDSSHLLANFVLEATRVGLKLIGNKINSTQLGALASIVTSANELIEQTNNEIKGFCENNAFATPHYANQFNVMINQQLAENLALINQSDLNLLLDSIILTKTIIAMDDSDIKENNYE